MRLVFGLDFDTGCWPGPLGDREAAAGEAWVGPLGLLERLEVALGVGGPPRSAIERVAAAVPALREKAGFWSRSAEVDAIGTARRLLDWRDRLALQGWRGEPISERLAALGTVTSGLPAGVPDRLADLIAELARRGAARGVPVAALVLAETAEEHAPLWRALFDRLQVCGVPIEALAATRAVGSDGWNRRSEVVPSLVRPAGPLAAAEEVAVALASELSSESAAVGTLVICGGQSGEALDRALHRHGAPTLGAAGSPGLLTRLLPLVLELGWAPPDPRVAAELLALPFSPVPRDLARRLGAALREIPAVGSRVWRESLAEGLERIDDRLRRERVAKSLAVLFAATVPRQGTPAALYPASEIERRTAFVESWLRGRLALVERRSGGEVDEVDEPDREPAPRQPSNEPSSEPSKEGLAAALRDALDRIAAFRSLRRAISAGANEAGMSAPELRRLLAESGAGIAAPPSFPAEAGLAGVGRPGGVAGPVDRVVWWDFTAASAEPVRHLPLTAVERAGLAALGLELPDPGGEALSLARGWRRPLFLARRELLLVAPLAGEDGEPATPHPLWDEIVARSRRGDGHGFRRSRSVVPQGAPRRRPPLAPIPAPRGRYRVASGERIVPSRLSPTGLETLLGCPFRWAIEKVARLEVEEALALPTGARLAGNVVHETLAAVLGEVGLTAGRARELAAARFDAGLAESAPELLLRGADAERAQVRQAAIDSAVELTRQLAAAGRRIAGMEVPLAGRAWGVELAGRADLVTDPQGIIDLKYSASSSYRTKLADGTALQLAAYAGLLAGDERRAQVELPPVAYFLLPRQRLLTTAAEELPAGERVDGPGPELTWSAAERAFARRREALSRGELEASGNPEPGSAAGANESASGRGDAPARSAIEDGVLLVAPPCGFCDHAALCGRLFAEEAG